MAVGDSAEAARLIARLGRALSGRRPDEILDDPANPAGSRAKCLSQLTRNPSAGVIIAYGGSASITTGNDVGKHAAQAITRDSARFKGASSIWGWTGEYGDGKIELIVFFISS